MLADTVQYTKLDVIHAFNQIRIKKSHKWLTAFNSKYGQFESLVILFGLCNAPGTFQDYIHEFLWEYLDMFCTAYLDDVLIYSTKKNYASHVLQMLKCLYEQSLQVDIDKCEFSMKKIKYLNMIVTIDGIKMDMEKTEAIQRWEVPTSMKKVQAFLGFANFYRWFIPSFSKISQPLVDATKRSQYVTKFGKKKSNTSRLNGLMLEKKHLKIWNMLLLLHQYYHTMIHLENHG